MIAQAMQRPNPAKNRQSRAKPKVANEKSLDILEILLRRKAILVGSALLGGLLGAAYFFLLPPKYESRAEILLMQNDSAAMASQMNNSESSVSEDLLATHMKLIQSSRIVKNALENGELAEQESLIRSAGDMSTSRYVIDNLYVTRGGDGAASDARILNLAFRHGEPEVSQKVVLAILEEYKAYVESKFRDINKQAVDLIQRARTDLETEIQELSESYATFREESPFLSGSESGANIYATNFEERAAELSVVEVSIDETQSRITMLEQTLKRLDEEGAHELEKLALIDDANASRLGIIVAVERGEARTAAFQALQPERAAEAATEYNSLLALKAQLAQEISRRGKNHPDVLALQTQINEQETFLRERGARLDVTDEEQPLLPDDVMKAYVGMLKNDLLSMQQRKLDLERQMAEAETKAKELLAYELENEDRQREILRAEDLYESVVERLRDINMQQDSTALIQDVIEEPLVGEQVAPSIPVAGALAILSTMLLSGVAILLTELQDKSVHSETELEGLYGAPVLSHVPDFSIDRTARALMKTAKRSGQPVDPSLLAFHAPQSVMSEGFRGIRTRMLMATGAENRVVAFTSPNPGDGKSTITANMAVSLASTGKKILLVDCDMRRSTQHQLFQVENQKGLSDSLGADGDLEGLPVASAVKNLTIVTAGENPDNPAELLSSPQFAAFIENARQKFDYVLLDCPPILPVSDPSIIASLVDGVVLVVSVNAQSLPEAEHCRKTLDSVGAEVVGVIVNRTGPLGAGYSYSNYGYESPYKKNGYQASTQ